MVKGFKTKSDDVVTRNLKRLSKPKLMIDKAM